jgi:hypothetical protein
MFLVRDGGENEDVDSENSTHQPGNKEQNLEIGIVYGPLNGETLWNSNLSKWQNISNFVSYSNLKNHCSFLMAET